MSDNEKYKKGTFCVNFFSHVSTAVTGYYRPCCYFSERLVDENEKLIHASNHSMQEYLDSSTLKDLQQKSLRGEKIEACNKCYHYEKWTGQSKRTRDNETFKETSDKILAGEKIEVEVLDLRLGNYCNLGCVSCIPQNSSVLAKLWDEEGYEEFSDEIKKTIPKVDHTNWFKSEKFTDEISSFKKNIKQIMFVGGEPLINKFNIKILEDYKDKGKSLELNIFSNITNLNEQKIELLENFTTTLNCSLDGIQSTIEYIRYPAKFDEIEKNFHRLCHSDIELHIIFTVSVLNIFHIEEAYNFYKNICEQYGKTLKLSVGNLIIKPDHLAVQNMPDELKEKAIEQLKPFYEKLLLDKSQIMTKTSVNNLINYLTNSDGDFKRLKNTWGFLEKFDQIRGNDWRTIAPYMEPYLS
ncbi:MAG: twitch domain-containing radical SAM protein [Bdellovibrionales bacterium]|nr:twitch domain-containing radical SAM protein [Bdellovibrionales bacterium]